MSNSSREAAGRAVLSVLQDPALRGRSAPVRTGLARSGPPGPSGALRLAIEAELFGRGGIGPIGLLSGLALQALAADGRPADERCQDHTPLRIYDEWARALDRVHRVVVSDFDVWRARCPEFVRPCAVVFGVAERDVGSLLREFHGLQAAERYGVFRLIRASTLFSYLDREFEANARRLEIASPALSFRELIRRTQLRAASASADKPGT